MEPGKYAIFFNKLSRDILDLVRKREDGWKNSLPNCVVDMIENKSLWLEGN